MLFETIIQGAWSVLFFLLALILLPSLKRQENQFTRFLFYSNLLIACMFGTSALAIILFNNLYWIGVVGEIVALPFGFAGYAFAAAALFNQIFPRIKPVLPIAAVALIGVFLTGMEIAGFKTPSLGTLDGYELLLWNEVPILTQGTATLVAVIYYPIGLVFLKSALKNRLRLRALTTTVGLIMAAMLFTLPVFIEREKMVVFLAIRILQVGSLALVLIGTQINR